MAQTSPIEWCDATFNPWWGCEKISPGCAHCYADTLARRRAPGAGLWGPGHGFRFFGDKHWDEPLRWARNLPAKLGRRPRVFCASMADVFEERPELDEPRERLFDLIADTPELDWLILTKRPEFARAVLAAPLNVAVWDFHGRAWPLPNVWLGVSIENARHTWRADVLREIPAAVRFISAEPLLGSLFPSYNGDAHERDTTDADDRADSDQGHAEDAEGRRGARRPVEGRPGGSRVRAPLDLAGIDWVIVGGESGHGARPMHPDWALKIRDACADNGVAFFFKQWGSYAPVIGHLHDAAGAYVLDQAGRAEPFYGHRHGSVTRWDRPAVAGHGQPIVRKLAKKNAGRLLDEREWNEMPR